MWSLHRTLRTGLCTPLSVDQRWRLPTEPPSHRRLSACVGVHYAPRSVKNEFVMCDLWLPWGCLQERRQSGSDRTTCRCKKPSGYEADTVLLSEAIRSSIVDRRSSTPPGLLEVCVSMHIHTLTRLCLCCVNMLKLIVLQVRTGPYTSLSGLIIHCLTPMTLLVPSQSCCSVICRIQEAALNKNTRNKLLFTSLIPSYTF